jgi:hypothetical protein
MPVDADGDLVKLSGRLEIEILDLARSGEEQRLGQWSYTPEQTRELWHSGLLAAGYQVELPLPAAPSGNSLLLHGRLVSADGRQFDTTHTIRLSEPSIGLRPLQRPRMSAGNMETVRSPTRQDNDAIGAAWLDDEAHSTGQRKPLTEARRPPDPPGIIAVEGLSESDPQPVSQSDAPRRLVPTPIELAPPSPRTPGDTSTRRRPAPLFPEDDAGDRPAPDSRPRRPRPFPEGVQTSDNWTDATLPRLR